MHCISPQNLKSVALSVQKLWMGSQILNLGHVTLTTPTLGGNLSSDGKYLL